MDYSPPIRKGGSKDVKGVAGLRLTDVLRASISRRKITRKEDSHVCKPDSVRRILDTPWDPRTCRSAPGPHVGMNGPTRNTDVNAEATSLLVQRFRAGCGGRPVYSATKVEEAVALAHYRYFFKKVSGQRSALPSRNYTHVLGSLGGRNQLARG